MRRTNGCEETAAQPRRVAALAVGAQREPAVDLLSHFPAVPFVDIGPDSANLEP